MLKFFSAAYLLNMRPGALHYYGIIAFVFAIILFISIIVAFSIAKKRKNNIYFRLWRKLNAFAISNLVLAIFILFFEYEESVFLSARIIPLLWLGTMLVWLFFIFKEYKKIPGLKKEYEKKMEYNKYIP